MEIGDLVIVTMEFPEWEWLDYTTGDIGIVLDRQKFYHDYIVLKVLFINKQTIAKIPEFYLQKLRSNKC